ncbi:MAG TPA: T9SS type A sorting domain-containing protein [Hymenobacter sp.]|jgi:hypothetical protein|uniref:T9SS type A sorting domain-containing protein n=1 Tax=Hymenobacter sp. TaxID=1898978 RepID=UPI002EDB6CA5
MPHALVFRRSSPQEDGLVFSGYAYYYQGVPQVTLRCNTFRNALAGGAGVWVKAGTPFPASLGTASQPNGNRFDGMADDRKRFMYDGTQPTGGGLFRYFRYDSASGQESFAGPNNDEIYGTNAQGAPTGSAPITTISGTNACGGSTTPGVNARSAATPPSKTGEAPAGNGILREAYPNPASETATFAYALPADTSPAALVLRNAVGQPVLTQPLLHHTGNISFSVSQLPPGLYVGTVEVAGQVRASRKLTIVR